MHYQIDENNAVLLFTDSQIEPILFQPYDPNGDGSNFASKKEAENWITQFIVEFEASKLKPIAEPEPTE